MLSRNAADDLAVAHVQEPGARIALGLAVLGRCSAIEVGDDGVTVGVEVAHRLCEPAGESGVAHRLGHTPTRPGIGSSAPIRKHWWPSHHLSLGRRGG
jgi:hypothetical protein